MTITVCFDLPHLYYLPQYLPVIRSLSDRNATCIVTLYDQLKSPVTETIIERENLNASWVNSKADAAEFYRTQKPDWVIFGNVFSEANQLAPTTKTALLFHSSGTSPKNANLNTGLRTIGTRFVSGEDRLEIFKQQFPDVNMVTVGFAKLDPIFNADKEVTPNLLNNFGLDSQRNTILYAPTFYPSSIENMPKHWPEDFSEYNIIIKPHDFSRTKPEYRHQLKRINHWNKYDNVYLADATDYSLVPFLQVADIMVSDTSSAIFEFAALDKPVVICDFVKLRWSYRGPLRFRLKKRLDETTKIYQDIAVHAKSYKELKAIVSQQVEKPGLLADTRNRYMDGIMGLRDGKASQRITDYLFANTENNNDPVSC